MQGFFNGSRGRAEAGQRAQNTSQARQLAMDGIFTALLVLFGMFRLPSLIPGAEFQLSAPYAVCLAAAVGFRRYLCIGVCSSLIQLALGTHTIWNVAVAMVFRVVAGLIAGRKNAGRFSVLVAGPAGTACARLVLAALLGAPFLPLLAAAVPGMIFTAVCAAFLQPVFCRALGMSGAAAGQSKGRRLKTESEKT